MGERARVLRGTVPQVREYLQGVDSLVEVHELQAKERRWKRRKGVLSALNDREAVLVQSTPPARYRAVSGVSLGGRWVNPHTSPEVLARLPRHVLQEGLRSGVLERVG